MNELLLLIAAALATVAWFGSPLHAAWSRQFDLRILWPSLKRQAADLEHARHGFIVHMGLDPAWRALCADWTEEQFGDFVREKLQ